MALKSVFTGFKSVIKELEGKEVSQDFWLKEQKNIIKQVKKAKKEKVRMMMDNEKYHRAFSL